MKRKTKIIKCTFFSLFLGFLIISCNFVSVARIENYTSQKNIESNSSWFWSNLEILSDTSTDWSYFPSIAIDSEDNIHVVWHDTTSNLLGSGVDSDIFYRFFDSTTEIWSLLELVSSESDGSSYVPYVEVDSLGNVHVVWRDTTDYLGAGFDYDVFYKEKPAGGSWSITSVISTDSTTGVDYLTLEVDNSDNLLVSWSDSTDFSGAGTDDDIFFKFYNYTSSVWTPTTLVSIESTADSLFSAIDINSLTGDVHFVWDDVTNLLGSGTDFDIFYRTWNIFSSSWSELEIVSTESTENSFQPSLKLDQNGDAHVVWYDYTSYLGAGSDTDIFYKKLDSSTDSWGVAEIVSTESTGLSFNPHLITDRNGYVLVAWYDNTDYQGSGTNYDIFFKSKNAFTNLWSLTDVVSLESTALANVPDLELDSFGFIYCVWSDETNIDGAGTDKDVFFRKLAGTPSIPILSTIVPNPSTLGNVSLNWKHIYSATSYAIYRSTSYIWSVDNMVPLAIVPEDYYFDVTNETGDYYYVVCARNEYGKSAISNVEHVEIIEDTDGLFASFDLTEILILAGIVLGLQIIGSAITYSLVKGSTKTKSKSKTRKK